MEKIFKELKREEIIRNLDEEINEVNSGIMNNEDKIWASLLKITKILVRQDQLHDIYNEQILQMQNEISEIKEEINKLKN